MSSPGHGSSGRSSNIRPPVHYPQAAGANGAKGSVTNGSANPNGNGQKDEFAPDDMFFVTTPPHSKTRKDILSPNAIKKAARQPFTSIKGDAKPKSEPDDKNDDNNNGNNKDSSHSDASSHSSASNNNNGNNGSSNNNNSNGHLMDGIEDTTATATTKAKQLPTAMMVD